MSFRSQFVSIQSIAFSSFSTASGVKPDVSSCAIFAADGGLVANAPHIPVHLGAMSHAVRYQANLLGSSLEEGDVLLSNHPAAGGSHLPDLTVIMPAFHEGKIIFWTAARAHHADIGGVSCSALYFSARNDRSRRELTIDSTGIHATVLQRVVGGGSAGEVVQTGQKGEI